MEEHDIELISKIQGLKRIEPDPSVLRVIRAQIMEGISRNPVPRGFDIARVAPVFAAAFTFVVLIAVTLRFSQESLPPSPLYQLKLAGEQIHAALVFDEVGKVELRAELARERVKEVRKLHEANGSPEMIAEALSRYEKNVREIKKTVSGAKVSANAVKKEDDLRVSAEGIAERLTDDIAFLLSEAETKLAAAESKEAAEVSKRFIAAAETSVGVLSSVVDVTLELGIDSPIDEEFRKSVSDALEILAFRLAQLELKGQASINAEARSRIDAVKAGMDGLRQELGSADGTRREVVDTLKVLQQEVEAIEYAVSPVSE